ncbi:DNA polymerase I [candidate division KSB1 bacterium]|nr:DNA polymerase I [candidate division KSB1 bacterium]
MSDSTPKRLFLLDGTALAYRSYFAFIRNPLINSKGINTSGVYGFATTLTRILKDEKPDYFGCVFDTRAPTFRHKMYIPYKATRDKMPDEMADQFPAIRNLVETFQIPILEKEGFEADDVMATLAKQAESQGLETYLMTSDKDLMQLVSDRVKMYSFGKPSEGPTIVDSARVEEKMGVPPSKIIDLLGLMGDSSDNIPGVAGVGPKTAVQLLNQFDSLEAVLDGSDQIERKSLREKIEASREQALLSKELVILKTDVELDIQLEDLQVQPPDQEVLIALFQDLEFTRLLSQVSEISGTPVQDSSKRDYCTVDTPEALNSLLQSLRNSKMFAVDLETTSLSPIDAEIVGLSFSWESEQAAYVPLIAFQQQGDLFYSVLDTLKPILENSSIRKCGQNIKYDMLVLKHHGILLHGVDFDTMVAAYLVNPSSRQYNLDALALEYLNLQKIKTKDLIGSGSKQLTMDQVEVEKVAEYACEDAEVAFRLREILEPKLKESETDELFRTVEMPLVPVLMEMEENGVALDRDLLGEMSKDMEGQLETLKKEIYEIAGEEFNINSTQQLGVILFEKLKVHELLGGRKPRRTKTGYSTDVRVLESLASHPLPKRMLDYRQLTKLKSTYIDALPKLIHPKTGRVHASFNQTVAATGRLSSSNPNLQNIPIRTELGREIRKAFIAGSKNGKILSADYSQIELRLMAHLSGDETLVESFRNGEDVHRRTAAEIFDKSQDEVTDDDRRQAKTINFGIMYGMGAYGLASRLSISVESAQSFIGAYFAQYPKVNEFIARTISEAHTKGYVTTLLNRRRYLPELVSQNKNIRDFGERTSVNTPIQGTAADMIKIAMIRISDRLQSESWQSKMILQIHDELVFDVVEGETEKLTEMVRSEMEGAIELSVPVIVDVGVGENWFEAH